MKKLLLLASALFTLSLSANAEGTAGTLEVQNVPGELTFDKAYSVGSDNRLAIKEDKHLDYMMDGGSSTFLINVTEQSAYSFTFNANTANAGVTLDFSLYAGTDTEKSTALWTATVPITNNGWSNNVTYTEKINQLLETGNYYFVIKYHHTGGQATANVYPITFAKAEYEASAVKLTTSVTGNGEIALDPQKADYTPGTEVTATAKAKYGYGSVFKSWTLNGETKTDNPLTFTINEETTLVAVFADEKTYNDVPGTLNWMTATSDNKEYKYENINVDGTDYYGHPDNCKDGNVIKLYLDVKKAGKYDVSAGVATPRSDVKLDFNIADEEDANKTASTTLEVKATTDNSSNWTTFEVQKAANPVELTAGKKVLTITYHSAQGQYTCNLPFVRFEEVAGDTNGIESVAMDGNAPVEYFNLQGVRVAQPENGIYLMRQGTKVVKVLVK